MTHVIGRPDSRGLLSITAPFFISLGLFLFSIFIPPLGILSPIPLYYSLVARGQKIGLLTIASCSVAILALTGEKDALFFLVFCGLMAVVLAESFKRRASLRSAIGAATLAPLIVSAIIALAVNIFSDAGILKALDNGASEAIAAVTQSYKDAGADPQLVEWVERNSDMLKNVVGRIFFGMTAVSLLFAVIINCLIIKILSLKFGWGIHFTDNSLANFKTPDYLVWPVIAGGVFVLLIGGAWATAGINLLLITGAIYLIQGIAIIHHFLLRSNLPIILKAIGYFLLFSQPPLLLAVCCLGFADVWANFRKIGAENG
ncbi:hypothetical protein MNBD_NITROSPINAE04-1398 [hydrothermal vent metagenome]|uniref:DUF2232 domain-containing protein n=1 Tax=hydrothermal vent metagenome TaxID=652676 RepID=A0A3B1CRX9_9ZZZZ